MHSYRDQEMICLESQHFSLNKTLLSAIGLWPYQHSKLVRIQFVFFSGILAAAIIFQLTTFTTSKYAPNIIKTLSTTVYFTVLFTKYTSFLFYKETMKEFLAQLQHFYNDLKEEKEIAIMKKYGYDAKRCTAFLTTFGIFSISTVIITQFWTTMLDFVLPKNESRPRQLHIAMEYFLDEERFFYLIILHLSVAIFIGKMAVVAVGTMLIACFQHVCGIFTIASYRIEHAIEIYILQGTNFKNEYSTIERLIRAIIIHRQAMQLCNLLMCKFEMLFFCLIILGVACLSLNLIQIFQTISSGDAKEFVLPVLLVTICIIYMFLANYVGQDITDHNNYVYVTAYNVQWYKTTLPIQKIILFVLQRGVKTFTLTIGGLFDASFEGFAMLVKASVSYFTVIYSTR